MVFANNFIASLVEVHRHLTVVEFFVLIALISLFLVSIMVFSSQSDVVGIFQYSLVKHRKLESVWSILPFTLILWLLNVIILCTYLFDDMTLCYFSYDVLGFQWYWSFEQFDVCIVTLENVKLGDLTLLETLNWIVVPVGSLLKVLVSAIDVIHSFSIPALGVKIDAIPGRLTTF